MKTRVHKLEGNDSRKPKSLAQSDWIWGVHAVNAAVSNSRRRIHRLLVTANGRARLAACPERAETVDTKTLSRHLPAQAVHQGVALLADPLPMGDFGEICANGSAPLVILDQVSDPRNIGAVFRCAAAFGACGVVMHARSALPLSGALAKAAAGGIEIIPGARVTNIARTIGILNDAGWITLALGAGEGTPISEFEVSDARYAIVLGAEGRGVRPLVARACSFWAHIPTSGDGMPSLNVSVAAAIALYRLCGCRQGNSAGEDRSLTDGR